MLPCHEICTSRFTKCLLLPQNLHFEVHKALRLPQESALRGSQTSHTLKSHDSLHLSQNQSTSKSTTVSKVLRLPRSLHFEVKPLRSLAPLPTSRLWTTKFSLAPATTSVRKCARHDNESAVTTSTRRRHPDFASLRSRNAL